MDEPWAGDDAADREQRRIEARRQFGNAIRRRREALTLSKRQVAARARIADSYLASLERGDNSPSVEVLAGLAFALRTTADELLGYYGIATSSDSVELVGRTLRAMEPSMRVLWLLIGNTMVMNQGLFFPRQDQPAAEEDESEPVAAYDREDLAREMRRQALGWMEEEGADDRNEPD